MTIIQGVEKMNDNVTISTFQLFKMFPDAESARLYLEARRWKNGVRCAACNSERVGQHSPGYYRCNACKEAFTVRTGTIFERSHVPLHKWLYAMYLLVTARKGISSIQLSKEIGITQKSAWFVLHRLREACGDDLAQLQGNEFAFRLNDGNCKRHTLDRLDSFVSATVGKRLTYKALIQ